MEVCYDSIKDGIAHIKFEPSISTSAKLVKGNVKLMKKAKYLLVAVVLVVAMMVPMVVSAASPVNGPVAVIGVPEGVSLGVYQLSDAQKSNFTAATTTLGVKGSPVYYADISLSQNGVAYQPGGHVLVRVDIAGISAGDKITILHDLGGTYATIEGVAYNGYVVFATDSFSPFAFYNEVGGALGGGGGGTTPTSPSTGVYA